MTESERVNVGAVDDNKAGKESTTAKIKATFEARYTKIGEELTTEQVDQFYCEIDPGYKDLKGAERLKRRNKLTAIVRLGPGRDNPGTRCLQYKRNGVYVVSPPGDETELMEQVVAKVEFMAQRLHKDGRPENVVRLANKNVELQRVLLNAFESLDEVEYAIERLGNAASDIEGNINNRKLELENAELRRRLEQVVSIAQPMIEEK
jgi:hypothetical protein